MVDLSKEQYKVLRKIKKHGAIQQSSLSDRELTICRYLLTVECLEAKCIYHPTATGIGTSTVLPSEIRLSQTGEAQIYAFRSTFYKWWVPVVISIIALIISIAVPVFQELL